MADRQRRVDEKKKEVERRRLVKQENERRAEVGQVITNTSKLRRARKKQLKGVVKR